MKKNNDKNEPMTRSERRAKMEEEEKRISQEPSNLEPETKEKPLEEIPAESPTPLNTVEDSTPITETNTEEIQVGEIEKAIDVSASPANLPNQIDQNTLENLFYDEPLEKEKSSFNPITWIGISMIGCFAFFIYLVIGTEYDEKLLLFIDSIFLLGIVFLFCVSILCNRKWMKVFSFLNLFIILGYIGTNAYLFYDWNEGLEKQTSNDQPKEEKIVQKNYTCEKEEDHISSLITTENEYIISITRKETFDTEELLEETKAFFQETDGLTISSEDNVLTLTFDFKKLDINEYKNMIRDYLESKRETTDFNYIVDDKLVYTSYIKEQLDGFTCQEKEG